MSRRNQARRRRSYGRRQHELGERRTAHELRTSPDELDSQAPRYFEPADDRPADDRGLAGA